MDQADPGLFRVLPSVDASGTLTFTPVANNIGKATFSATVYNALTKLFSAPETFTISIYAPPTTDGETYVVDYTGGNYATASDGVLSHDTDPNSAFDGGAMTAVVVNSGSDGYVYMNSDGSFKYYPSNGVFAGYDQISYQAAVGPATSPTQTVTIYSHEGAMVEKLYRQVLFRDAGRSEVMNWAPQLHGGLSMTSFGGDIIESSEHLNTVVTGFFYDFLGRSPSSSDLSYWDSVWVNNGGPEQVIIGIASTPECFNYAQTQYLYGDQNSNWLALAYQQILSRAVDSGALSYFTGQLDNGYMSRAQVAQTLATSSEYRTNAINNYYSLFLGRAPSSSDQQYWLGQMQNGTNQLSLQETLIASGEYFSSPQAAVYDPTYGWYDVNLWKY